jgi:hypothetical protein
MVGIAVPMIMLSSIASMIAISSAISTTRTLRCGVSCVCAVCTVCAMSSVVSSGLLAARLVSTLETVEAALAGRQASDW